MKILGERFFRRPTPTVAQEMLGKFLVRRIGQKKVAGQIVEVEVYDGFRDKASHASRGETVRNVPMFGPPGHWYVYFTYGMHWMLNIVTREKGYPAAVLIRGVEGLNGPARLTKKLKIDKRLNGRPASQQAGLWIEDRGVRVSVSRITKSARIGVLYAGPVWAKKRWRFFVD